MLYFLIIMLYYYIYLFVGILCNNIDMWLIDGITRGQGEPKALNDNKD